MRSFAVWSVRIAEVHRGISLDDHDVFALPRLVSSAAYATEEFVLLEGTCGWRWSAVVVAVVAVVVVAAGTRAKSPAEASSTVEDLEVSLWLPRMAFSSTGICCPVSLK